MFSVQLPELALSRGITFKILLVVCLCLLSYEQQKLVSRAKEKGVVFISSGPKTYYWYLFHFEIQEFDFSACKEGFKLSRSR